MTTGAVAGLPRYRSVIKQGALPGIRGMASITGLCGNDVIGAFAGGDVAVVAGLALIVALAVIKRHNQVGPGLARAMTGIALICGERMPAAFTGGDTAAVTAYALIRGLAVVERCDQIGPLLARAMTSVALIGG